MRWTPPPEPPSGQYARASGPAGRLSRLSKPPFVGGLPNRCRAWLRTPRKPRPKAYRGRRSRGMRDQRSTVPISMASLRSTSMLSSISVNAFWPRIFSETQAGPFSANGYPATRTSSNQRRTVVCQDMVGIEVDRIGVEEAPFFGSEMWPPGRCRTAPSRAAA